jgi:hypothetical protein
MGNMSTFIHGDCKCKKCRRAQMMRNIEESLKWIGGTSDQYEDIEKAINDILDRREDGTRNKD